MPCSWRRRFRASRWRLHKEIVSCVGGIVDGDAGVKPDITGLRLAIVMGGGGGGGFSDFDFVRAIMSMILISQIEEKESCVENWCWSTVIAVVLGMLKVKIVLLNRVVRDCNTLVRK